MRVAWYGGSFNPPHHAHVLLATLALCDGGYDALWLIPTYAHAFNKALAPFEVRCEMVAAAFAHLGPRVQVKAFERDLPSPSYTIQTLEAALARFEEEETGDARLEVTLMMGTDTHAERHRWREWARLEALLEGRVEVFGRGEPSGIGRFGDIVLPPLSSTEVRQAVAEGRPIDWMVSPEVEAIIKREGLYR